MAGSEAEERIRAKGEVMLRTLFPAGRIIHELVLEQGGVRIDLATVTPDRLVCLEVKSERDVLTRLPAQIAAMREVADAWGVLVAEKHLWKAREACGWSNIAAEDDREYLSADLFRNAHTGLCNAPARFRMLWASELQAIRCPRKNAPRLMCIQAATDSMTGSEVRRAVCAALRSRSFPRADAPIVERLAA